MLETIDLALDLDKPSYKAALASLQERLRQCQNVALEQKMPVAVVFEGWDAAGKGSNIGLLTEKLDPRHFKVHPIGPPTREEERRPFLWRFWRRLPPAGDIAIFDRSWYGRVLVERVDGLTRKAHWRRAYDEIAEFERQLTDGGALLVKLWLQISKKEQKKRFKRLEADPTMAWKVTKEDWRHHRHYAKYEEAVEEMLARTSTHRAPWTVVEAEDERYGSVKVHETIVRAIGERARAGAHADPPDGNGRESPGLLARASDGAESASFIARASVLDQVDLAQSLPRDEYNATLRPLQAELRGLQQEVRKEKVPVLIVYEGWDASGKGGNIKRLTRFLDPRGYDVTAYAAPTEDDRRHHYLWRFWRDLPAGGRIGIFDRSWYGRVLVERVEGLCSEAEWRRAYQEINEFERQLTAAGTVLVKFWLEIDPDEQLRRFKDREQDRFRHWKLTAEDWRNREKFTEYREAVTEMLEKTSTRWAPWTIVEANDKPFARVKTLRTTIAAIEEALEG